jgi:hypothetical protein
LTEETSPIFAEELPVDDRQGPRGTPTPREHADHRQAMKTDFPEGWSPQRKVSREAMDAMRMMHRQYPEVFTTPTLAEKFCISPEAVRRILKSRWEPGRERRIELADRAKRMRDEWIVANREREREERMRARTSKEDRLTFG